MPGKVAILDWRHTHFKKQSAICSEASLWKVSNTTEWKVSQIAQNYAESLSVIQNTSQFLFLCASGRSKFGVVIIITHWSIKIRLLRKLAKPNRYVTFFETPCSFWEIFVWTSRNAFWLPSESLKACWREDLVDLLSFWSQGKESSECIWHIGKLAKRKYQSTEIW